MQIAKTGLCYYESLESWYLQPSHLHVFNQETWRESRIDKQQNLFVQHPMRGSITCALQLEEEKIGRGPYNSVGAVKSPCECVLPAPKEYGSVVTFFALKNKHRRRKHLRPPPLRPHSPQHCFQR